MSVMKLLSTMALKWLCGSMVQFQLANSMIEKNFKLSLLKLFSPLEKLLKRKDYMRPRVISPTNIDPYKTEVFSKPRARNPNANEWLKILILFVVFLGIKFHSTAWVFKPSYSCWQWWCTRMILCFVNPKLLLVHYFAIFMFCLNYCAFIFNSRSIITSLALFFLFFCRPAALCKGTER